MTIENAATVLELLKEDATLRVYQYRHARTGAVLYAVFLGGKYDDMDWAPEVLSHCSSLTRVNRPWPGPPGYANTGRPRSAHHDQPPGP